MSNPTLNGSPSFFAICPSLRPRTYSYARLKAPNPSRVSNLSLYHQCWSCGLDSEAYYHNFCPHCRHPFDGSHLDIWRVTVYQKWYSDDPPSLGSVVDIDEEMSKRREYRIKFRTKGVKCIWCHWDIQPGGEDVHYNSCPATNTEKMKKAPGKKRCEWCGGNFKGKAAVRRHGKSWAKFGDEKARQDVVWKDVFVP